MLHRYKFEIILKKIKCPVSFTILLLKINKGGTLKDYLLKL